MTINKAKGQTISNVGTFLPDAVFADDLLYVALSRDTAKQNVKVLAYPVDQYTRVKGAKAVTIPKGKKRTRHDKVKEAVEKSNGGTYKKTCLQRSPYIIKIKVIFYASNIGHTLIIIFYIVL
jgi:hypothetical protein